MPLFCSYHADFDGICEGNYISITNPCSFWPIPRVLVSQTERNRQRQNSSGVVKKRVRFGSSREKKKLITQHNPPLPRFFTPLLLFRFSIWHCVLPTKFPEQPMFILPHSLGPFLLYTVCPKEAILLSGSGKISSTNYPKSNYTASRNCTWNITAPADKIVNFTFTDFVLSECSANNCSDSCSYVELYDGGSISSPSLRRFCQGSSWNETQLSTGNQMFVMFHPGQTVDRGFEAKYSASARPTTSPPTTKTTSTSESETTNESGEGKGKFSMNFLCIEYSKLINAFCYEKLLRPTSLMIHYR